MSISRGAANILLAISPEIYLLIGAVLLLLVVSIPLWLLLHGKEFSGARGLVSYAIFVCFTTVYYRLPFFTLAEANPDESQEIAAALTLWSDPVYWRSVDLQTHGPLSTYPLMLPHLFGIQIDYGSARLTGLAMLLASALLIFSMLRKATTNTLAVIAVLPIITFICMTDYWDFIAYNAEHPVILTVVLSLYFTDTALRAEKALDARLLYIAGVVVGSVPFVKIQSLPMVFIVVASTCAIIWFRRDAAPVRIRLAGIYFLGCLTFASLVFICLWYFDLYGDFVVRYLSGQMNYAKDKLNVLQKINLFLETFDWVNLSAWYYFDLVIIADILFACVLICSRAGWVPSSRQDKAPKATFLPVDTRQLSIFFMVTAMSLVAIYIPGRHFRHYFVLLAFPLGLLTGKLFILTYKALAERISREICAVLFIIVTAGGQYYYKYLFSSYNMLLCNNGVTYELLTANSNIFNTLPVTARDKVITDAIKKYTYPGEKMALWGWANKYYINTNLIIACRTTNIQLVSNIFGNSSYYLKSFMQELETAKAPVFLDAVAPGQFTYTEKSKFGFEQFPQIKEYIQSNYSCLEDINGVRIFVSKQRSSELEKKPPLN